MLHFGALQKTTPEEIRITFNEVFKEYFVPVHFTPEQLR